jgi:phosphoglycolate phosphatase
MKYKAVLFDLDGTLLDTLHDIADSMNAVLGKNGFASHPVERYKKFIGGGVGDLARRVLPDGVDDATAADISMQMRAEYAHRWGVKTRLYPGIDAMLNGLVERNLWLSILSNKPDDFTRVMCEHFLGAWPFRIIMGASDKFSKKPDPSAALYIARHMEIDPAEFLYLGDSDVDMKTAVAAGMLPIGALWGFRDERELLAYGAKQLLRKPEDMLPLVSTPASAS